jgi:hypothetical protein
VPVCLIASCNIHAKNSVIAHEDSKRSAGRARFSPEVPTKSGILALPVVVVIVVVIVVVFAVVTAIQARIARLIDYENDYDYNVGKEVALGDARRIQ